MRKKQNITPRNADGQYHGLWIFYYKNGNIDSRRRWVNGKTNGIRENYWDNGKLWFKEYNIHDKCVYREYYWYANRIHFGI